MAKIAIDNGHGLYTAGKRTPPFPNTGKVVHEWQFNHPTAKKLEKILKGQGHQVLMVSDTEIDTSLSVRSNKANQWGADILVSIHYNAYESMWGTHGGIETLYKNNSKGGEKLAKLVQEELIKATGLRDRGAKPTDGLHMLNKTKMIAVLSECGFMDNLDEAKLMLDKNYQMKCAKAIAIGLNRYLNYTPNKKEVINVVNVANIKQEPSSWAKEAWEWAEKKKLLDGNRPKDMVTREEMAVVLKRLTDSNIIK